MMKSTILAIPIIALSSLLFLPVISAHATSLNMVGSQWSLLELFDSKLTKTHADTISTGGVQFMFPDATATPPGYANLMTDSFTASLTTTNTLTATIQVLT